MTTKLPFHANTKFATMCDTLEETHARLLANQRRIKSLEDQQRHVGEHEPETFEEIGREIERVSQRRDNDADSYQHQSRIVASIRNWLLQVPASAVLEDASRVASDEVSDSETVDQGVVRCREDIERQKSVRAHVARSVPPLGDLHAAAAAYVEALAVRGRPRVSISSGQLTVRAAVIESVGNIGGARARDENALAVAAWLHPEAVVERLREQIDEVHAAEVRRGMLVMTTAERDRRLAELDEDILRLERLEEFYVDVGAQYGLAVERRSDADPRAVLGVTMRRPQRQQRAA